MAQSRVAMYGPPTLGLNGGVRSIGLLLNRSDSDSKKHSPVAIAWAWAPGIERIGPTSKPKATTAPEHAFAHERPRRASLLRRIAHLLGGSSEQPHLPLE